MCFPLGSTSGTFCGPTESFAITIGPGKKAVAQSRVGEEGNICGESGAGWLPFQESCVEPRAPWKRQTAALMELISAFPL